MCYNLVELNSFQGRRKKMKKSEMIDAIAKETGVTKTDVEKVFKSSVSKDKQS